jgi:rare lipoprotein A
MTGIFFFMTLAVTGLVPSAREVAPDAAPGNVGIASYYAHAFHGRRTASGEIFDMGAMTAAHRTLPFGTRVRVTSLESGRSVEVRINDRGPFRPERIVDLSYAAAGELGLIRSGLDRVRLEIL